MAPEAEHNLAGGDNDRRNGKIFGNATASPSTFSD